MKHLTPALTEKPPDTPPDSLSTKILFSMGLIPHSLPRLAISNGSEKSRFLTFIHHDIRYLAACCGAVHLIRHPDPFLKAILKTQSRITQIFLPLKPAEADLWSEGEAGEEW